MALVAFGISLLIVAVGALGIISPPRLLAAVRHVQTPAGLYAIAALRLVFGAALFLAAPTSRAPETVRIVGIVVFVAGLTTPLFGLERFRRLLDWGAGLGPAVIRGWASLALGFGLLLAYAVVP